MRIAETAIGVEHQMVKQFQNLPVFGIFEIRKL